MNNDELDASIPILTEIIAPEQDFTDAASTPLPSVPLPPAALSPDADAAIEACDSTEVPAVDISAEAPPSPAISDSQWEALEHKISERVLSQLQTRIDSVLEQQVRERLASALQLAVDGVVTELRRSLNCALEDVISGAISQEIAQLKSNHKPATNPTED